LNNENTSFASPIPRLISIGPNDYVEKYDVGFEFPSLDERGMESLRCEYENRGKVSTPIKVILSTTRGYVIIDGWSRYQIAKKRQLNCQALLYENLTPQQIQELFLYENLCQRQISPKERKELAFKIREKTSLNNTQIARLLGVDPSTVSGWFNPKTLPPLIEYLIKAGNNIDKLRRGNVDTFENPNQYAFDQQLQAMLILPDLARKAYEYLKVVDESYSKMCDNAKKEIGDAAFAALENEVTTLIGSKVNGINESPNETSGLRNLL